MMGGTCAAAGRGILGVGERMDLETRRLLSFFSVLYSSKESSDDTGKEGLGGKRFKKRTVE